MENNLLEMARKLDDMKQERVDAQTEAKSNENRMRDATKQLELIQHEAHLLRSVQEQATKALEKKANDAQMKAWQQDLTIQGLEKVVKELKIENERLRKVK